MEKISPNIVVEKCKQAGVSFWLASEIALELGGKLPRDDEAINELIIEALKKRDHDAAVRFEGYHSIRVRTSKNRLESFDRARISQSIMRETHLPRIIADQIAEEIEDDVRRLQLKSISAPLIREMVNTKLLERRLIEQKINYTRVGLPVYDINTIIEREQAPNPSVLNEIFGNAVMEEYVLTKVLPQDVSVAYLNADIHIHSLEHFITSPISFQNDLRLFLRHGFSLEGVITTGPPKKAEVAVSHAARVLLSSERNVSSGTGFDFFNVFLAPYIHRKNEEEITQVAQTFLYELNQTYAEPGGFSINLDTRIPRALRDEKAVVPGGGERGTYGDYADDAERFLRIFLRTLSQGDNAGKRFRWPEVCIKYRNKADVEELPRNCHLINQAFAVNSALLARNALPGKEADEMMRAGIMQSVSINMPKIGQAGDDRAFFSALGKTLDMTRKVMAVKAELIAKRLSRDRMLRFLTQRFGEDGYAKLDNFRYLVSFAGFPEACTAFLEKGKYDKECLRFGQSVLRFTKKKFREYSAESGLRFCFGDSGDAAAAARFADANRRFGSETCSASVLPAATEGLTPAEAAKEIQIHCNAGAFFETPDKNVLKDKDFLFLRLV